MALLRNDVLVASVLAWGLTQLLKVFTHRVATGEFDPHLLISAGGMPSSHSAFVAALTTAVGLRLGMDDPLFAVCVVFASIVMYDAAGIRRAASQQARLINRIIQELFDGHPLSQEQLKELLGHTPLQVIVGALLGIVVAWVHWVYTTGR